ncbi:MAG TPA: glycosyltransferase family 4 protein [Thermoleophilaceae bacterium]
MRVTVGHARIAHHGSRSGYWRLIPALRRRVPVQWVDGERGAPLPPAITRALVGRAGVPWYDERSLAVELGMARSLLSGGSSICHALYAPDTLRYSPVARRRGRGRLVATVHQPPAKFEEVVRDKRPLQGCDAVIASSRELRDHVAAYVGEERAFHIPLGVESGHFTPGEPDPAVCLFVGWWLRDLDVLAAVIREVGAHEPELRFEAVVPAHARERIEAVPGLAVAAGVSDEKLLASYRRAGMLVLPLLDASANCALLEAAACGLPIVTTAVGGVGDYLDGAAELVPPGDAEAMADRVLALARDPARRRALGEAARRRAEDHDWELIAGRHLDVYERVAG